MEEERIIDNKLKTLKRNCCSIWHHYNNLTQQNERTDFVQEKISEILNELLTLSEAVDAKNKETPSSLEVTSSNIAASSPSRPPKKKYREI